MSLRVCAEPGCPELSKQTRCLVHTRVRDKARGTSSARGYGTAHQSKRAGYQRLMDVGQAFICWRCAGAIDPADWTLGHCDDDRTMYHGPECPPCDYATSGRADCPHPSHMQGAA